MFGCGCYVPGANNIQNSFSNFPACTMRWCASTKNVMPLMQCYQTLTSKTLCHSKWHSYADLLWVLQNIWEARPNDAPQRHTLDNPLTTYPSLCNPQGLTHYPSLSSQNVQGIWGSPARSRASASLQGLEPQGSSEFMPGSLSSVAEGEGWAAQQMRAGRGVRSVDQSVPFGSSPERVRLLQEDYHTRGSER